MNPLPKPETKQLLAVLKNVMPRDAKTQALVEALRYSPMQQDVFLRLFMEVFGPQESEEDENA